MLPALGSVPDRTKLQGSWKLILLLRFCQLILSAEDFSQDAIVDQFLKVYIAHFCILYLHWALYVTQRLQRGIGLRLDSSEEIKVQSRIAKSFLADDGI